MTESEFLIRQAQAYWSQGQRLPLDLFANLISAGLDVDALERRYMKEPA
jgi:phage-related baseplate assembly protein